MNIKNTIFVLGLGLSCFAQASAVTFDTTNVTRQASVALAKAQDAAKNGFNAVMGKKSDAIVYLTEHDAHIYGLGAIALITVAGVTYVLYENGTLILLADYSLRHPYRVTSSVVATAGAIALFVFAYKNDFDLSIMQDKIADLLQAGKESYSVAVEKVTAVLSSVVKK